MYSSPALRRLMVSAACLCLPAVAISQEATTVSELDEITVSAASKPLYISETGVSVDVITEETLAKAPLSFAGLLAALPGVSMNANGGLGTNTSVRVRGLPAYYLGTRVDGIDVTDPSGTQLSYNFGGLTTQGLSRVEVLRGAQSALYGSEAVAGVVDITTWRPEKDGFSGRANLETGANATHSGGVSAGFRNERTELAFTIDRTISDGISAYAGGEEKDAFRATQLSAFARHAVNETLAIGANLLTQRNFAEYDSPTADADRWAQADLRGGRLFAQVEYGAFSHELSVSRMKQDRDIYEFGGHTYFVGDRKTLAYTGGWNGGDTLSFNWGAEHKTEDFSVISSWSSVINKIETNSVYAEALYAPTANTDLSFAIRHDDHSRFGGQNSARAALAWHVNEDWIVRAVAATGFRAPSPYELWSSYGSPNFKPEQSRNLELGVERLWAFGSVRATLFDTKVDDQIIFDNSAFRYSQTNGLTRSRGVEVSGRAEFGQGWEVFANYTYSDAKTENAAGGYDRAVRAPRHSTLVGLSRSFGSGWKAGMTVQHVADRLDDNTAVWPPVAVKMPDYTVANLTVSYDLNDQTQAYVRIENLFDETYQTAVNYGQPGRSVYLGVGTKF